MGNFGLVDLAKIFSPILSSAPAEVFAIKLQNIPIEPRFINRDILKKMVFFSTRTQMLFVVFFRDQYGANQSW